MGLTYYRIYDGICNSRSKRVDRGKKKKHRRIFRADSRDGWARKKAGGLAPAFRPSKREINREFASWGM